VSEVQGPYGKLREVPEGIREAGTITHVKIGCDHTPLTISLDIQGPGWGQGFGGLAFESQHLVDDFAADLCAVFGVERLKDLRGKPCYALRCFPRSHIEGLEAPGGKRFVITNWRRKHWPHTPAPLAVELKKLRDEAVQLRRRAAELEEQADRLPDLYEPIFVP
jgi:hypothetical protein